MAELKLNANKIFELAEYVSKFLHDNGIDGNKELKIEVTKDELTKIDEDLYYRNKPDDKDEFEPSDKEVVVNYHNLVLRFVLLGVGEKK